MKKYWQSAGLYVLIFVIILAALAFSGKGLMQPAEETKVYNYSDLISELDQDNVKTIEVTKSKEVSNYGTATAVLDDGTKMTVNVPSVDVLMEEVSQMPAEGSDIQIPADTRLAMVATLQQSVEVGDHILHICQVDKFLGDEDKKGLYAWNGFGKVAPAAEG